MHALACALAAAGAERGLPAGASELLAALQAAAPELCDMDVHIASFGGVGSTQLSNHLNALGLSTNLLTDADGLRHCPRPPNYCSSSSSSSSASHNASAGADAPSTSAPIAATGGATALPAPYGRPRHVVYLYGDPLAAVASHYRRGHACHQAQKTSGTPARLSPATFPATFDEYVARGEDLFGLEDHWRGWTEAEADYPIVLVRYERMYDADVARPLLALLCGHKLPPERVERAAADFTASKRQRESRVPPEYYSRMYGSLLAAMDALPPLHVRPPSKGRAQ